MRPGDIHSFTIWIRRDDEKETRQHRKAKPRVKNGGKATITTKGKTKRGSRNPWRTGSFEVPRMQWQEERVMVPSRLGCVIYPALLSPAGHRGSWVTPGPLLTPQSQSQSLLVDQSCSKYKMKKQTHCQSRILGFSPHFADVVGIGLQMKNIFSEENQEKNSTCSADSATWRY